MKCPNCNEELSEVPEVGEEIMCENCHTVYEIIEIDGVLDLMLVEEEEWPELGDQTPLETVSLEDSSNFYVAIGYTAVAIVMIILGLAYFLTQ